MNIEQNLRHFAKGVLPQNWRQPLGILCGGLRTWLVYPLLGLVFDLGGGRFRAGGCTFYIPRDITSLDLRASFLLGSYEEDERRLLDKFLRPDDSVLELGACLGIVACITNKKLQNPARHVVVEANPYCLPAIHRNRIRNGGSFLVEHCAVTNQRQVDFSINLRHITGSSLRCPTQTLVRLPGRSLSELVERHGPFSTLIMDVEGSELELLESSRAILGQFRLILIELHEKVIGPEGILKCREILVSAGFKHSETSYITEVWLKD